MISEDGSDGSEFVSPRALSQRWQCSRSSVDRVARRAGLKRYIFGSGRNGMVRYLRGEVIDYEAKRQA